MAKWQDAFELTADGKGVQVKQPDAKAGNLDFIDRDPDRFNVWVFDKGSWESTITDAKGKTTPKFPHIEAKISTTNVLGFTSYDDNKTAVDLVRYTGDAKNGEAGWYWSDSQMLVSNEVDDKYSSALYLQTDEAGPGGDALPKHTYTWHVSDRTHTVALRGTVRAEYTVGARTIADTKPVLPTKVVNVHGLPVRLDVGDNPSITPAAATAEINEANEQYAQVGILLLPFCETMELPTGLQLTYGFNFGGYDEDGNKYVLTDDEKNLFRNLTTPAGGRDSIQMYFINYFTAADDTAGIAYPASEVSDPKYADLAIIATTQLVTFLIGHEIGHVLLNPGPHTSDATAAERVNLMQKRPRPDAVNAPKRLTPDQETDMLCIRQNLLKNP